MPHRCPDCKTRSLLEWKTKDGKATVDWCKTCRGVWLDRNELGALIDVAIPDLGIPRDAQEVRRPCPRCHKAMYRFDYPQTEITVEMCKECNGIWLDKGEYQQIKSVRQTLEAAGKLHDDGPVAGVKGSLIAFINGAIEVLRPFGKP
ncbi:MAG: hypothetical protein GY725_15540 [bacterium]|nr:hypothetical protein [bacterium]